MSQLNPLISSILSGGQPQDVFFFGSMRRPQTLDRVLGHGEPPEQAAVAPGEHRDILKGGWDTLVPGSGSAPGVEALLSPSDLAKMDAEENRYQRMPVQLGNGSDAWAYFLKGHVASNPLYKSPGEGGAL